MTERERARWMLGRLRAMSPGEVVARAARGTRRRVRRPRGPVPQDLLLSYEAAVGGPGRVSCDERTVAACLDDGRWALLAGGRDRGTLHEELDRIGSPPDLIIARAERILSGRIPAFGWRELDVGPVPNWHRDPGSERTWPLSFWADLDYRGVDELGEPRLVWEVNRHHHLVTLARAHIVSGNDIFARAVWEQIRSWVESNPPLFGINWTSALETSLRLVSWALSLDLLGSAGAGTGDVRALATSVALQVGHVSDNLSVYASSRNNHLTGEAVGLLVAGVKFPFVRGADRARRVGRRILERQFRAQVAGDGTSLEQAFHYHAFIMELGLLGWVSSRAAGAPLSDGTRAILGRMSDFLVSVAGPGGVPPAVGDADGGRVLELSDAGIERYAARAAAAAALAAGLPFPSSLEPRDAEPAVWLFGPLEARAWLAAAHAGGRTACRRSFREGGYFVTGDREHHGVIDCGPLGLGSLAAHGHADCLALAVSWRGRWIVVDPGTYCFHRERAWRDHFRSTAAHSTVCVDGADQSQMVGPFMWGRKARACALHWACCQHFDYFEGRHDGYRSSGVVHRRAVVFGRGGYWLVLDRVEGAGRHDVRATFQMAPGLASRDGFSFTDAAGGGAWLVPFLPAGFEAEVLLGSESPRAGFVSEGFGTKRPAPALIVRGSAELPVTMVTAILPLAADGPRDVRAASLDGREGAVVRVGLRGGEDVCFFGPSSGLDAERFSGVFGLIARRGIQEEAFGIDVLSWTRAGAAVKHTALRGGVSVGE